MSSSGGKSFVLAAALLGACAWVIAQRARSWWAGEGRLAGADGVLLALDGTLVRHAQWTAPRPLPAPLPGNASLGRPAISADGRWLVFAAGERGQDVGLYLCERHGDALGAAQRLAGLDSPADELAPAFGAEGLYFASDRAGGAGGLDLWRAPFADGVTGEPEHLGGALASAADDTDPAPGARAGELVFASNRGGDFDLYLGLDAETSTVLRLEELASPADEREPVFASAEQVLAFATDRRARGDFDLWRSVRALGAVERGEPWPAPCPLEGLNSAESERGPAFAPDGFEITFTRAPAGAPAALWQARSHEVFEIPRQAWTWIDTAVVGSLLLLAVVTWLARRMPALELLYKCLLVSVLLHLLLLFALQYWLLGGGQIPQGDPLRPRVRFVPGASAPSASSERAGRLEARLAEARSGPERAELASADGLAAPEAAPLVDLPEGERPSAPERGRLDTPAAEGDVRPAVALARPSEARATRDEPAAALELSAAAQPARAASAGPQRPALEDGPGEGAPAPAATATLAQRPSDEGAPAPARASDGPSAGESRSSAAVLVAQPSEAGTARRGAPAATLELGASAASAASALHAPSGPAAPEIASLGGPAASGPAQPRELGGLLGSVHAAESSAPARAADAAPSPALQSAPSVALEGPAQSGGGAARRSDPAPGLALESAAGSAVAAGAPGGGPGRASLSSPDAQAERGALAPGPLALSAPRAASGAAEPPARAASEPGPGAQPGAHPLALEDAERGATRRTLGTGPAADLGSTLEPSALAGRSASGAQGPPSSLAPPALASSDREAPPAPASSSPLARLPAEDRALPPVERRPWDHTPYENRAGAEKARALALHGGDERTEEAVARGLAYLARIQHKDGSWGPALARDDKYGQICIGKTGLALLAFLGAGHTQRSGTLHSAVVQRALGFLTAAQQPGSGHIGDGDAYSHGIATYALAECLAMTHEGSLRPVLERAVAQILAHQDRHQDPRLFGGWSYYFADGHVYDRWPRAPITAWQVMALESARLSGLAVPDAVFEAAQQFLENTRDDEAGYWRYNHDTTRHYATLPASTPAGMFALSLMGADLAAPDYAALRRFVLERRPDGYRYEDDDAFVAHGTGNLYFWYYGTLAMFRAGGASWASWNEGMKQTLVPAQNRDGSWEPIDPYARYARDGAGDKSYTTALCVLSLEIYYRYYLPLLKVR